jgi:CDP-diacylglycerol--serine O-phosphatidyltransferase
VSDDPLHAMPHEAGPGPTGAPRQRRFRQVPLRIILPNLVTLLALCLGLTAVRFAYEGRFETAVVAIAAAAVLDGLDGRIARALKGTSRFGAELDSLADFVDFGVAPAFVLYSSSLFQIESLGWFSAMVFAVAAALRLARFNVALDDPARPAWTSNFFVGMPAPAGAVVGLLPIYLHLMGLPLERAQVPFEAAFVLFVAFLMASRIPHFSGKNLRRVPPDMVILVLFGVAVVILLLATYPLQMLVALTIAYICTIPFGLLQYRKLARADLAAAAARAERDGAGGPYPRSATLLPPAAEPPTPLRRP